MSFLKPMTFLYVVHVAAATPVLVKRVVGETAPAANSDGAGVRRHQDDGARARRMTKVGATGQVLKDSAVPNTDPVRRAVKDTLDLELANQNPSCTDTQDWTNGHRKTCAQYASEGWCHNHRVSAAYDFWAGFNYNHPENSCCACGKGCSNTVRSTFHSLLCRDPSPEECYSLTAQTTTQTELEAAVRGNFTAVGSGCTEGIPACDGCQGRPNECYAACKDSAGNFAPGMCSKCDAVSGGIKGACCMKDRATDPPECHAVPSSYFKFNGYHTCVLVDKAFPKCEGCVQGEFNPLECWSACGKKGGYCSVCDSTSNTGGVIPGACCMKNSAKDPIECQYAPAANFFYNAGHSCVLTEVPKCTGCGAKPGECWTACNGAPGHCSACDSLDGTPGACCRSSAADDPAECRDVRAGAFRYNAGYHECVLTNQARAATTTAPAPTLAPTPTPEFDAALHSTGDVCETSSYTTVPLVNGEPASGQACNGWDMSHLTISAGEDQCWQYCLSNTIAPGCESVQTAPCVASEYWTAYKVCHLHSSCDQAFHKQPGANTRRLLTLAPTAPTPPPTPPTTAAPTNEPASAVSAAVEVHTASTAKPMNVTCSGSVTSDAHCVSWYKAEPEPLWYCELFPDRPAAEVKFSTIEKTSAAVVLHDTTKELKYYGVMHYWDWNTLQTICKTALTENTPSSPR